MMTLYGNESKRYIYWRSSKNNNEEPCSPTINRFNRWRQNDPMGTK